MVERVGITDHFQLLLYRKSRVIYTYLQIFSRTRNFSERYKGYHFLGVEHEKDGQSTKFRLELHIPKIGVKI